MHGNEKVIEQLNAALASELTAIVQYMVQSETCQNWGYVRIGDFLKRRAIEEMGHAEGLEAEGPLFAPSNSFRTHRRLNLPSWTRASYHKASSTLLLTPILS